MDLNLLVWLVIFAIIMYIFDKLMTKWINRHWDCPDVYSETGVEAGEDVKDEEKKKEK